MTAGFSAQLPPMELGYAGTPLRRTLVDAVLRGMKTGTSGLASDFEAETDVPLPCVGDRRVVLDFNDEPAAIVEITEVRVLPAGDVDLDFARAEGEGFGSVADWRRAHEQFWSDRRIEDDTLIVAERFRLVRRL